VGHVPVDFADRNAFLKKKKRKRIDLTISWSVLQLRWFGNKNYLICRKFQTTITK
jgi:hypothetical protein